MALRWLLKDVVLLAALATLLTGVGGALEPPVARASGPCDSAPSGPPIGPTEPTISGVAFDATTDDGIASATLELYRCTSSGAVLEDTEISDANGDYAFEDVSTSDWHYVEAVETGPLVGLNPAAGYAWQSALWPGSGTESGIDFGFE